MKKGERKRDTITSIILQDSVIERNDNLLKNFAWMHLLVHVGGGGEK